MELQDSQDYLFIELRDNIGSHLFFVGAGNSKPKAEEIGNGARLAREAYYKELPAKTVTGYITKASREIFTNQHYRDSPGVKECRVVFYFVYLIG